MIIFKVTEITILKYQSKVRIVDTILYRFLNRFIRLKYLNQLESLRLFMNYQHSTCTSTCVFIEENEFFNSILLKCIYHHIEMVTQVNFTQWGKNILHQRDHLLYTIILTIIITMTLMMMMTTTTTTIITIMMTIITTIYDKLIYCE